MLGKELKFLGQKRAKQIQIRNSFSTRLSYPYSYANYKIHLVLIEGKMAYFLSRNLNYNMLSPYCPNSSNWDLNFIFRMRLR